MAQSLSMEMSAELHHIPSQKCTVEAIEKLQTRQNVMGKTLKGIDLLSSDTPIDAATMLLQLETEDVESDVSEKPADSTAS